MELTTTTPIQETWQEGFKKFKQVRGYLTGVNENAGYNSETGYFIQEDNYGDVATFIETLLQRKERETISKAIEFFSKHKNEPMTGNVVNLELMRMRGDYK